MFPFGFSPFRHFLTFVRVQVVVHEHQHQVEQGRNIVIGNQTQLIFEDVQHVFDDDLKEPRFLHFRGCADVVSIAKQTL